MLIDQPRLPLPTEPVSCRTPEQVAPAILTMKWRVAPAIGVAAAFGLLLAALAHPSNDPRAFLDDLERTAAMLRQTRPTAVNLDWALDRMLAQARVVAEEDGVEVDRSALMLRAPELADQDRRG